MLKFFASLFLALMIGLAAKPATAHFQLLYTPDVNVKKAGTLPLRMIFWHPMSIGHIMAMGQPEEFYALFKGKKTDLMPTLKPITFTGPDNSAAAFEGSVTVKRNGDYTLVLIPSPYYEESEDIYIQQITKSYINKGDLPTDWAEPAGLPTEIIPLNKPYGAVVGSTFSGLVLSDGKPVVGAKLEIEFIPAEPDLETNKAKPAQAIEMPGGALVTTTDANGIFTFGIPKAGHWGFAALDIGPVTEHNGKKLSQDAVIWVRAHDFK